MKIFGLFMLVLCALLGYAAASAIDSPVESLETQESRHYGGGGGHNHGGGGHNHGGGGHNHGGGGHHQHGGYRG